MYRRRGLDAGGILFGLILLGVGVYYIFRNTLGFVLPEIDSDQIWPLIVVAIGLAIVLRAWNVTTGSGSDGGAPTK